jgi:hypothetical protein
LESIIFLSSKPFKDVMLLPGFSAAASLLSDKAANSRFINNTFDYYTERFNVLIGAQSHTDPKSWCNEDGPCDPVTHTKTICRWRDDIQDCVCSNKPCNATYSCSCSNRSYRTENDCISAGYSWCCVDRSTGIGTCKTA